MPVTAIAEHAQVNYDVVVVAVLERPAGTTKLLRACGVPDAKVLMLRPDWPSPGANGRSDVNGGAASDAK